MTCKNKAREDESVSIRIRMPAELAKTLEEMAASDERSRDNFVRWLVTQEKARRVS